MYTEPSAGLASVDLTAVATSTSSNTDNTVALDRTAMFADVENHDSRLHCHPVYPASTGLHTDTTTFVRS